MSKFATALNHQYLVVRNNLPLYLRLRAAQLGISPGAVVYNKFIVLGRPRSGSCFLSSCLNSHHEVFAYGEIFNEKKVKNLDYPYALRSFGDIALKTHDPVRFIDTRIFRPFPKTIKAVGFKIFYHHARQGIEATVWSHLKNIPALLVIHLKRKNILKSFVSGIVAVQTGQYLSTFGVKDRQVRIELDYQACLDDFIQTERWMKDLDGYFRDRSVLEIFYEDLLGNFPEEMKKIQRFLNIANSPMKPTIFRQEKQPLAQTIINYHELKERFQDTRWDEFFIE